jgi:hypothetical protein
MRVHFQTERGHPEYASGIFQTSVMGTEDQYGEFHNLEEECPAIFMDVESMPDEETSAAVRIIHVGPQYTYGISFLVCSRYIVYSTPKNAFIADSSTRIRLQIAQKTGSDSVRIPTMLLE